jgi:hypothetical protein
MLFAKKKKKRKSFVRAKVGKAFRPLDTGDMLPFGNFKTDLMDGGK